MFHFCCSNKCYYFLSFVIKELNSALVGLYDVCTKFSSCGLLYWFCCGFSSSPPKLNKSISSSLLLVWSSSLSNVDKSKASSSLSSLLLFNADKSNASSSSSSLSRVDKSNASSSSSLFPKSNKSIGSSCCVSATFVFYCCHLNRHLS